jgi:apolipoprotein N-acyltransferase
MKNLLFLILFSIINFFSWNYCGILFLLNIIILFHFIDYLKLKKWYYTYLIGITLFLLFNISATFWLIKVDSYYSIYAFIVNSFLLFFPFALTIFISNRTKHYPFIFIFSWVLWEWILSKWDLAWPWLNFGNVMSNQWYLIKWYSVLGTYSGSIWLLTVGFLLYSILLRRNVKKKSVQLLFLLILPVYSLFNYSYSKKVVCNKKIEILTYCPAFQLKKRVLLDIL